MADADEDLTPPPGPAGPCRRCGGVQWVQVLPSYVAAHTPLGAQPGTVAGLENTWYPCKDCNAGLFYRWAAGHFNPDHDIAGCGECSEIYGKRTVRRHPELRDRKDING